MTTRSQDDAFRCQLVQLVRWAGLGVRAPSAITGDGERLDERRPVKRGRACCIFCGGTGLRLAG